MYGKPFCEMQTAKVLEPAEIIEALLIPKCGGLTRHQQLGSDDDGSGRRVGISSSSITFNQLAVLNEV